MSWLEVERRLALGIEPIDAVLGRRLARPLFVEIEGIGGARTRLSAHGGARHSLLLTGETPASVVVRLYDRRRGYVPRRLRIPLPDPAATGPAAIATWPRIRRPRLLPGVDWDLIGKATALRGRVRLDGAPLRWVRIVATRVDDSVIVLRSATDDRGEFLLVLDPETIAVTDLRPSTRFELDLRIYGPSGGPSTPAVGEQDPLWDLPIDELAALADADDPDPVAAGEVLPSGWDTLLATGRVTLSLGCTVSDQHSFDLTSP